MVMSLVAPFDEEKDLQQDSTQDVGRQEHMTEWVRFPVSQASFLVLRFYECECQSSADHQENPDTVKQKKDGLCLLQGLEVVDGKGGQMDDSDVPEHHLWILGRQIVKSNQV